VGSLRASSGYSVTSGNYREITFPVSEHQSIFLRLIIHRYCLERHEQEFLLDTTLNIMSVLSNQLGGVAWDLSLRVRFPAASLGRMCCHYPWGFFPGAMSTGHRCVENRQVKSEALLTALDAGPAQHRTTFFTKYSLYAAKQLNSLAVLMLS
jgi:hypothetical protein